MKMQSKLILLILTVVTVACGKKLENETASEADTINDSAEVGIQVAGGMADDQAASSFATRMTPKSGAKYAWFEALVNPASAADCSRAASQSCDTATGVKLATYSNCAVGYGGIYKLNGYVSLDYSANSCSLNVGENVSRTFDWTISGPRGRSLQHTSAHRSNYLGQSVGGGGQLSHTASTQWQIDIAGKHVIAQSASGRSIFDISVKTSTPVVVSGSLDRSNRTIASGQIDVYHNLAKFTASFAPQNLVYSSTCCYPVSGSINVTYTGSVTGSGSITFNGCGSATLTRAGSAKNLDLSYCE